MLKKLRIIERETESSKVFDSVVAKLGPVESFKPHVIVAEIWREFNATKSGSTLNGSVFEYALATALVIHGVTPFYQQVKLLHIPGVDFDFVAFENGNSPIVISAKTSLRERWKQAELEGRLLKQVYQRAKCYLVTLDKQQGPIVAKKVDRLEAIGFDGVIQADQKDFDKLVLRLAKLSIEPARNYPTVIKGRMIDSVA